MDAMDRHELSDSQWTVLESCLPPLNTGRGRKMHDRLRHINGILWILKNRCPMARLAGETWQVENRLRPISALGTGCHLGLDLRKLADSILRGWQN